MKFRGLQPNEIDVRVGQVKEKGVSLLLYKDARCDMNILDETIGSDFWQRVHSEIKGNIYCGVSIYNETIREWVTKWDCGTESNTEKEKGEASDSFKRACFNWGIGRELYTTGFIFIPCETTQVGNKYQLKNKYEFSGAYVKEISYTEQEETRTINKLIICSKNGKEIFNNGKQDETTYKPSKTGKVTDKDITWLKQMLEQYSYNEDDLCASYNLESVSLKHIDRKKFNDIVAEFREIYKRNNA